MSHKVDDHDFITHNSSTKTFLQINLQNKIISNKSEIQKQNKRSTLFTSLTKIDNNTFHFKKNKIVLNFKPNLQTVSPLFLSPSDDQFDSKVKHNSPKRNTTTISLLFEVLTWNKKHFVSGTCHIPFIVVVLHNRVDR